MRESGSKHAEENDAVESTSALVLANFQSGDHTHTDNANASVNLVNVCKDARRDIATTTNSLIRDIEADKVFKSTNVEEKENDQCDRSDSGFGGRR